MIEFLKQYILLTWDEIRKWIYANNKSMTSYFVKLFIGMMIYIIISDYVKKAVLKLQGKLNKEASDYKLGCYALSIFRYLINTVVVCVTIRQLNIVEVDPLMTIAVSGGVVIILTIQGVFTRLIRKFIRFILLLVKGEEVTLPNSKEIHVPRVERDSELGKFFHYIIKLGYKLICIVIAMIVVLFCYRGIKDFMYSGGEEISEVARLPEYKIVREIGTKFETKDELAKEIPIFSDGMISVRTNGDMNIIYFNGHKVGVNTDSRKYKLYDVSIFLPEVTAVHRMTYKYTASMQIVKGMYGNNHSATMYYNIDNNDCLIITVNSKTNRVSGVTYYEDLRMIAQKLDIY